MKRVDCRADAVALALGIAEWRRRTATFDQATGFIVDDATDRLQGNPYICSYVLDRNCLAASRHLLIAPSDANTNPVDRKLRRSHPCGDSLVVVVFGQPASNGKVCQCCRRAGRKAQRAFDFARGDAYI